METIPQEIKTIIEGLIAGTITLSIDNVNSLNFIYSTKTLMQIVEKQFDHIHLITNRYIAYMLESDKKLYELLNNRHISITSESPIIIKGCAQYVIDKYVMGEIDNKVLFDCFSFFYSNNLREKAIGEYIKKGFCDLSKFKNYTDDGSLVQIFNANVSIYKFDDDSFEIEGTNIDDILRILNIFKTSHIKNKVKKIHICFGQSVFNNNYSIIKLLKEVNKTGIELTVDGGLSFRGNYNECLEFIELCNCGTIELLYFDLCSFRNLLSHIEEKMESQKSKKLGFSISVYVNYYDFKKNEDFFLNLKTDVTINFYTGVPFKYDDTKYCWQKDTIIPLDGANSIRTIDAFFESVVYDIKNSDLSPLEKAYAIYQIVVQLKYKNYVFISEDDRKKACQYSGNDYYYECESRDKFLYVLNGYIVCSGFVDIFINLLHRVGIGACGWVIYDDDQKYCHERALINIDDEKYHKTGYFMCDPTWDSELKDNKYFCRSIEQVHSYSENSPDYEFYGFNPDCFRDNCFRNPREYISSLDNLSTIIYFINYLDNKLYQNIQKVDDDSQKRELIIARFEEKTVMSIDQDSINSIINNVSVFFGDNNPNDRLNYYRAR